MGAAAAIGGVVLGALGGVASYGANKTAEKEANRAANESRNLIAKNKAEEDRLRMTAEKEAKDAYIKEQTMMVLRDQALMNEQAGARRYIDRKSNSPSNVIGQDKRITRKETLLGSYE